MVYSWLCFVYTADTDVRTGHDGLGCDIDSLRAQASTWKLAVQVWDDTSYPIQYCVSQPVTEHCKLQLSIFIMCVVIGCNAVKTISILLAPLHQKSPPLVTLKDAFQSFLLEKDPTTERMCLAGKQSFKGRRGWKLSAAPYSQKRYRWFSSASWKRWLFCNLLYVTINSTLQCSSLTVAFHVIRAALVSKVLSFFQFASVLTPSDRYFFALTAAGFLVVMGFINPMLSGQSFSYLWHSCFGAVTAASMVDWQLRGRSGLLVTILIANSP
jgi:hypothetical protein